MEGTGHQGRRVIVLALSVIAIATALASLTLDGPYAEETRAAACLKKVKTFIQETDRLLVENVNDVLVFDKPIKTYLPAKGCNVDAVLAVSRGSKFFSDLFDSYASYTVSFKNTRFIVSFSLRKDTGDIEYPAARTKMR